jgi:hypothetical protein
VVLEALALAKAIMISWESEIIQYWHPLGAEAKSRRRDLTQRTTAAMKNSNKWIEKL